MNAATPIFSIIYWLYVIIAFVPIFLLIQNTIHIPVLNFIIALFISGIPIVNVIVGIIGAIKELDIPVIGAILFYILPIILLPIISSFIMDKK